MFCEHAWIQTTKLTAVPICGVHHTGCDQWLNHSERIELHVCLCVCTHAHVHGPHTLSLTPDSGDGSTFCSDKIELHKNGR
jgi:hypothetical protein